MNKENEYEYNPEKRFRIKSTKLLDSYQIIKAQRIKPKRKPRKLEDDLEWIANHQKLLSKHTGKYVAIYNNKIVGVGTTSSMAFKKAKKKDPYCDPILFLVSSDDLRI